MKTKLEVMIEASIDRINQEIELLKQIGIEILDNQDADFCLDYVRWSRASDAVTVYLTESVIEKTIDIKEIYCEY